MSLPVLRPFVVRSSVVTIPLPPPSDESHRWAFAGSVLYSLTCSKIQFGRFEGVAPMIRLLWFCEPDVYEEFEIRLSITASYAAAPIGNVTSAHCGMNGS